MKHFVKILICLVLLLVSYSVNAYAKEYVLFGEYPQSEVEATVELKTAEYDEYGDTEINSVKYRRVLAGGKYRYFIYEPLEWERVGDIYVAKNAVDCLMYDEQEYKYKIFQLAEIEYADPVTWEECSLRTWLNSDFFETAFTDEEKAMIVEDGDKVTLFSVEQCAAVDDETLLKKCSDYANAKGCDRHPGEIYENNVRWYLKDISPVLSSAVCTVDEKGYIDKSTRILVTSKKTGVVPCIKIDGTVKDTVIYDNEETVLVYAPYGRVISVNADEAISYLSAGWYMSADEAREKLPEHINAKFSQSSIYDEYKPYVESMASDKFPKIYINYPHANASTEELISFIKPIVDEFFTGNQADYIAININVSYNAEFAEYDDLMDEFKNKVGDELDYLYPYWSDLISRRCITGKNASGAYVSMDLYLNGDGVYSVELSEYFDKMNEIVDNARSYSDRPLGQIQYFRNYLAENVEYNGRVFGNDPLRLILDREGICGSYAAAVKDFCDIIGIPCLRIVDENMDHAWNCVYLENKWYMLDTTGITSASIIYKWTEEEFYASEDEPEVVEHDPEGFPDNITAEDVDFFNDIIYINDSGYIQCTADMFGTMDGHTIDRETFEFVMRVSENAETVDKPGEISVVLNGHNLSFDVAPVIVQGRTLVPMRAIFEALGATVYWNNDSQTATAVCGVDVVNIQINKNTMTKNGESIVLDVPAQLIEGRTLVPVRAVSECFGADVSWNNDTRSVIINK